MLEKNETDLELALDDLKNIGLATVKADIEYGETELNVMRCRRGEGYMKTHDKSTLIGSFAFW